VRGNGGVVYVNGAGGRDRLSGGDGNDEVNGEVSGLGVAAIRTVRHMVDDIFAYLVAL
jgi:hypothetical protein